MFWNPDMLNSGGRGKPQNTDFIQNIKYSSENDQNMLKYTAAFSNRRKNKLNY